jgi:hypothetical protein
MNKKFLLALLALLPVAANAVPVKWTLDGVRVGVTLASSPTIIPWTTLTGSFVYDADTMLYSQLDILAGASTGMRCDPARLDACYVNSYAHFDSQHYNLAINSSPSSTPAGLVGVDGAQYNGILDGDTVLVLRFAEALTNAGGIVNLAPGGIEYFCGDLACTNYRDGLFRSVLAPNPNFPSYTPRIISTPIPEPTPLALLALGFFVFMLAQRLDYKTVLAARSRLAGNTMSCG